MNLRINYKVESVDKKSEPPKVVLRTPNTETKMELTGEVAFLFTVGQTGFMDISLP